MRPILTGITSLTQHLLTLLFFPDAYRPKQCPNCGKNKLWHHGRYYRQPDRNSPAKKSLNPMPILRFKCPECRHSCSVLPECIPPKRWYLWEIQQVVTGFVASGGSIRAAAREFCMHRSTVQRWLQRFKEQFLLHADAIKTISPDLGQFSEFTTFWRHCLQRMRLSQAMITIQNMGITIP